VRDGMSATEAFLTLHVLDLIALVAIGILFV
jgi:hypothetical protein